MDESRKALMGNSLFRCWFVQKFDFFCLQEPCGRTTDCSAEGQHYPVSVRTALARHRVSNCFSHRALCLRSSNGSPRGETEKILVSYFSENFENFENFR